MELTYFTAASIPYTRPTYMASDLCICLETFHYQLGVETFETIKLRGTKLHSSTPNYIYILLLIYVYIKALIVQSRYLEND